jgi:hypothetical protein
MLWQIGGHDAHAQIKRIDSDNGTVGRVNPGVKFFFRIFRRPVYLWIASTREDRPRKLVLPPERGPKHL